MEVGVYAAGTSHILDACEIDVFALVLCNHVILPPCFVVIQLILSIFHYNKQPRFSSLLSSSLLTSDTQSHLLRFPNHL